VSCRQVADEAEIRAGVKSRSGQHFRVIADACERHVCRGYNDQSAAENCQVHRNEAADWPACRPITRHSGDVETVVDVAAPVFFVNFIMSRVYFSSFRKGVVLPHALQKGVALPHALQKG